MIGESVFTGFNQFNHKIVCSSKRVRRGWEEEDRKINVSGPTDR